MSLFENCNSLSDLFSIAAAIVRSSGEELSPVEQAAVASLATVPDKIVCEHIAAIRGGADPLGDKYGELVSAEARRPMGATYTPADIVTSMISWAAEKNAAPARVVDAGTGSARFLVAAGRQFPNAQLVGVELDPGVSILARAHLCAVGMMNRTTLLNADFRLVRLETVSDPTLYIGNPPYVRHHQISDEWKSWLSRIASGHGHKASKLAGLHIHFFLAVLEMARPGDIGIFVTAAEWLDVNYGRLLREMLVDGLGGINIQVIEPTAAPFPGTATTAAITAFEIGATPNAIGFRRVGALHELGALPIEYSVTRHELKQANRWTPLSRRAVEKRQDFVELGELVRVHRGQVTGANRVWIQRDQSPSLPASVLYPCVTRARELFETSPFHLDSSNLRRVIDIPADLSQLDADDLLEIERFLSYAKSNGADEGFIARHRKAWWSVGLREPAPILATYMARRPPAFVLNTGRARHINIAHGLYPRQEFGHDTISRLIEYLSTAVSTNSGRTYAGGLTKFEPREMERLLVPTPEMLARGDWSQRDS